MSRRDVLVGGLLVAVLVAILLPLATLGVDQHHDGIMLKPALDVLSGQTLFRDTFTQYGALSTYLQVAVLRISPTLAALRFMTVAAYAVALGFLFAAWRLILPRSLAALSCVLFILFIPAYEKNWLGDYWLMLPWSSVYALAFQSLAVYALACIIQDRQAVRWGAVLGMACAAAIWCRQPVGLLNTGCVVLVWPVLYLAGWTPIQASRRSILLALIAGFAGVNLLLLGNIALTGATAEWWYQNFVWPSRWAQGGTPNTTELFLTRFLHLRAGAVLLILVLLVIAPGLLARAGRALSPRRLALYYAVLGAVLVWQYRFVLQTLDLRAGGWTALLPVVVLVQALVCLVLVFWKTETPRRHEYYQLAALAALAAGSLPQFYPIPDPWHAVWALAPGFGVAVYAFWRASGWTPAVTTAVLSAAFLPAVWTKAEAAAAALHEPWAALEQPAVLRGMRVPAEKARTYELLASLLARIERQQPGRPAALIGDDALFLCFVSNLANPSPYYVTWGGLLDGAMRQQRWNYIQDVRPVLILHRARWDAVNDFYRRAHYLPVLYIDSEALEVALPQELADALGLKVYGASAPAGPAPATPKP